MMIPNMNKGDKLRFFQELYAEARNYSSELYDNLDKYYKQYKGDKAIDGSEIQAKTVRNITYEFIEAQISSNLPSPEVRPKMWSEVNERNAKSIETMLANKRDELPYEKLNDIDERYTYIYGASIWLVEWDNSILTHNSVGDVKLTCVHPSKFTGQPNIYTDIEDMEYAFIEETVTKDDIVRRYGVTVEVAEDTQTDDGSADDKTATIYICFYKDENGNVCKFVWSADVTLEDIDDYYARKVKICKKCGKREQLCECETPDFELQQDDYEELDHDIQLNNGLLLGKESVVVEDGEVVVDIVQQQATTPDGQLVFENINGIPMPKMIDVEVPRMEQTKIPYYKPKSLPIVIRKNTSEESNLFGQSDCEFIRPQQQAINKVESKMLEKLMLSGITPYMPEDATMTTNNRIFGQVIKLKPGETAHMYGTIDTTPNIQQDIMYAERLYDQAKRILGISDSFLGQQDSTATSGVAKQLQIQQSAGRLESKRKMKNAAHAEIDKIIFEYYLAYADEPRPATYKDAEGKLQNVKFNRYDFLERDENGEYYYNDEYLFSTDTTVDLERSRALLWQENRQNFSSGTYGDPAQPQTQLTYWLNMEKAHYPWAHENVERIREQIRIQQMMIQQQQAQQQQGGEM